MDGLGGPHSKPDILEKRKNLLPLPEFKPHHSEVTLPVLHYHLCTTHADVWEPILHNLFSIDADEYQ
jgi:hypothetical protein